MKSLEDLATVERYERAAEFSKWAQLLLRGQSPGEAYELSINDRASARVQAVTKAAVSGMTLGDVDSGALVDLQIVSSGFTAALRNIGAFDRMLGDGAFVRVPLATPGVRLTSTALVGATPDEGEAKPIERLNFTGAAIERRKADCIVVVSDTLVQNMTAAAQALVSRELRNGVVGATDLLFLSTIATDVAVLPSAGGTAAAVLADLEVALQAVPTGAGARLYLIVPPAVAKRLTTKPTTTGTRAFPDVTVNGGSIAGIPLIVSDHLPALGSPDGPAVMLVDASQIAADSEVVVLDQARHASVEMSDAPTMLAGGIGSPSPAVPAAMVSLWQVNARGLRASRYFGFRRLRDTAVAVLGGGW